MRRTVLFTGLLLAALTLAAGCSEDAKHKLTPPAGPEYLLLDSEDNLVANLQLALEAMDIDGYAALLYDHEPLSSDGLDHGDYHFIFDQSPWGGPPLPEYFDLAADLVCMGRIFAGEPGDGVPGVRAFEVDLTPNNVWHDASGDDLGGESCPDGTRSRAYETNMLITLKSAIEGSAVTAWYVSGRLLLYCVPVEIDGATEWRLWRWVDVEVFKRTEDASFSLVKWLYQ